MYQRNQILLYETRGLLAQAALLCDAICEDQQQNTKFEKILYIAKKSTGHLFHFRKSLIPSGDNKW